MNIRLDRFLTSCGLCSRTEALREARRGHITVNGETVKDPARHVDPERDEVSFQGERVLYRPQLYIMLNKPAGYVSATEDPREKTVLELLEPAHRRRGLFPCGRLDKDTVGLLILTDDGQSAHRQLSPKYHAEKTYEFETERPLTRQEALALEAGVTLEDGYLTRPCRVCLEEGARGTISLTEGKYHQIKRMMEAVGTRIIFLKRISFGGVKLDESLAEGSWRYLTAEEEALLKGGGSC